MPYGLLGHPLGHSLSPRLHELLAGLSGKTMEYALFDVAPEGLDARMPALLGLDGFNITIPYKRDVIPYLDRLDESAGRIGSVNTVARIGGEAVGYNTDCVGFLRALDSIPGFSMGKLRTAAVLGAGGTGRMCAAVLAHAGLEVTVGARASSIGKARTAAEDIARQGGRALAMGMEQLNLGAGRFDLLVNATPCGMFPHTQDCPAALPLLESCRMVFDCVYNPAETLLLQTARRLGLPAAGGLRMLVWQAAAAQEIWYGTPCPAGHAEQAEQALAALLRG